MTLQQIKYILGVAEAGSFNRASEKLFISQPSLTSSVHDAERELGFEVFNRTSRGVNATERARILSAMTGKFTVITKISSKNIPKVVKTHFQFQPFITLLHGQPLFRL